MPVPTNSTIVYTIALVGQLIHEFVSACLNQSQTQTHDFWLEIVRVRRCMNTFIAESVYRCPND